MSIIVAVLLLQFILKLRLPANTSLSLSICYPFGRSLPRGYHVLKRVDVIAERQKKENLVVISGLL